MNFYTNLAKVLTRVLRGTDAEQTFNSVSVQVRASDGYINLSAIASANRTDTTHYFRNKRVTKFLNDLKHQLQSTNDSQLTKNENTIHEENGGSSKNGGSCETGSCENTGSSENAVTYNKELVIKETNTNGHVVWAHPFVVLDFASWISTAMQIQILAWIFQLLCVGNVTLTDQTDLQNVVTLLKTQLDDTKKDLKRTIAERDEFAKLSNRLRLRRQRPALPPGSGVYVCMTEATPDVSKIGIFDGSINDRMRAYHTHSPTPVVIKAILFTNNFKHIEASLLETLLPYRKNSNEWISLPFERIIKLLQVQLQFQTLGGEDTAYMLDETSDELKKFNESTNDITDEDLNCVTTTITTTTNSDGSIVTTATTGLKWLDHMEVTCGCGETFETLRGHSIHVTKSLNPLCEHVDESVVKKRQHESNRKGYNGARIAAAGGESISCPVCKLEMAKTQRGLANHYRLGPAECREYGQRTRDERKAAAYNKGLDVSKQKHNAQRIAELGGVLCPAGCGTEIANSAHSIGLHLRYSKDPLCVEYNEKTKAARKRHTVRISNRKYMANKKEQLAIQENVENPESCELSQVQTT